MRPLRFSKREYDVLIRLAKTNIDIADELGLKESYIIQIVYKIMNKLQVSTRAAAIIQAMKHEIVSLYNFIV
jgi:DNA-binding NarL/FixJ family response regulator